MKLEIESRDVRPIGSPRRPIMHVDAETRLSTSAAKLKAQAKLPLIVGYAAVFNAPSDPLRDRRGREFIEVISPGAFAEALRGKPDVIARYDHGEILGRTGNGTLRVWEDRKGLRYELDASPTTLGRDLVKLIARGDIRHSSFTFAVAADGEEWRRENENLIRRINRIARLLDVSPVPAAAYSETSATILLPQHSLMRMRLELAERT